VKTSNVLIKIFEKNDVLIHNSG